MPRTRKKPKPSIRLLLQMEADRKYEVTVPAGTKVVEVFFGSAEDGWIVHFDNNFVPFDEVKEVPES